MIQRSIPRVLSTFLKHRVQSLLMGGQACILYGAAEFSRDIDFAVMVTSKSIEKLRAALNELEAERIFVPALSEEVLLKGHACHFRCRKQDVENLRIDIMGVMRGVAPFPVILPMKKYPFGLPNAEHQNYLYIWCQNIQRLLQERLKVALS